MISITMNELHSLLPSLSSEDLVLDVRSTEEYKAGHVAGSRHISYDQVAQHVEELRKYRKIYIYCHIGGRAKVATHTLTQLGLDNLVCASETGMRDWHAAGLPIQ